MDEILTWAEIQERFPDEWVAIADPEVTAELDILAGRVVYHGKSSNAAYAKLGQCHPRVGAVEFIGEMSAQGVPVVL